ncbi:hypothetical protein LCGC14_2050750, partial [marine sediment metagenome]
ELKMMKRKEQGIIKIVITYDR